MTINRLPKDEQPNDDDNRVIIISARVENGDVKLMPGTTVAKCGKCQEGVYVAPSSYEIMSNALDEGKSAEILCTPCALPLLLAQKININMPTKEQIDEMKRALENE